MENSESEMLFKGHKAISQNLTFSDEVPFILNSTINGIGKILIIIVQNLHRILLYL